MEKEIECFLNTASDHLYELVEFALKKINSIVPSPKSYLIAMCNTLLLHRKLHYEKNRYPQFHVLVGACVDMNNKEAEEEVSKNFRIAVILPHNEIEVQAVSHVALLQIYMNVLFSKDFWFSLGKWSEFPNFILRLLQDDIVFRDYFVGMALKFHLCFDAATLENAGCWDLFTFASISKQYIQSKTHVAKHIQKKSKTLEIASIQHTKHINHNTISIQRPPSSSFFDRQSTIQLCILYTLLWKCVAGSTKHRSTTTPLSEVARLLDIALVIWTTNHGDRNKTKLFSQIENSSQQVIVTTMDAFKTYYDGFVNCLDITNFQQSCTTKINELVPLLERVKEQGLPRASETFTVSVVEKPIFKLLQDLDSQACFGATRLGLEDFLKEHAGEGYIAYYFPPHIHLHEIASTFAWLEKTHYSAHPEIFEFNLIDLPSNPVLVHRPDYMMAARLMIVPGVLQNNITKCAFPLAPLAVRNYTFQYMYPTNLPMSDLALHSFVLTLAVQIGGRELCTKVVGPDHKYFRFYENIYSLIRIYDNDPLAFGLKNLICALASLLDIESEHYITCAGLDTLICNLDKVDARTPENKIDDIPETRHYFLTMLSRKKPKDYGGPTILRQRSFHPFHKGRAMNWIDVYDLIFYGNIMDDIMDIRTVLKEISVKGLRHMEIPQNEREHSNEEFYPVNSYHPRFTISKSTYERNHGPIAIENRDKFQLFYLQTEINDRFAFSNQFIPEDNILALYRTCSAIETYLSYQSKLKHAYELTSKYKALCDSSFDFSRLLDNRRTHLLPNPTLETTTQLKIDFEHSFEIIRAVNQKPGNALRERDISVDLPNISPAYVLDFLSIYKMFPAAGTE